jgi:DNA replication protein DnaC
MGGVNPLEDHLAEIIERVSKSPKTQNIQEEIETIEKEQKEERWESLVWARFKDADMRDFDSTIKYKVDLLKNHGKKSVMIVGGVGTGKTHLACAIAKEFYFLGRSVHFAAVVDLLDSARPGGHPIEPTLLKTGVLLLDDLGAEKPSEWTAERLYVIANRRWLNTLPNIVTTNFTKEQLVESVGERTISRLLHNSEVIVLGGSDRRAE